MDSPNNATVTCKFLSGFVGFGRCRVYYGIDSTYTHLPHFAESTEFGTAGSSVRVVLRERLNSSTVYYYNASAVSGDVTVMESGLFTTPQYSKYFYVQCFHRKHCVSVSDGYLLRITGTL